MKYFSIKELTHSDVARRFGIDNTPSAEHIVALEALVGAVLDPLREAWGAPIAVSSGYRCPELNKRVGGSAHSQHLRGEAADVSAGSVHSNKRLFALLRQLRLPVDQAIAEHGYRWLHISHTPKRKNRLQFLEIY